MGQTLFDKIWRQHHVAGLGDGSDLILTDRVMLHERTGGIALKSLAARGLMPISPDRVFATMDHVVDTRPGRSDHTLMPTGTDFIMATREAAQHAAVRLFDIGDPEQGIIHVLSPEQGIVLPGLTLVCPDSHTCSQGALGALAWGIGSTEAEHALATGALRVRRPRTMRLTIRGSLAPGVTAKDLALHLLGRFGVNGGNGHIVEYAGPAVDALDIEARLTLCNMATEFAAFSAIIAPDDTTFAYLRDRPFAPRGAMWDKALSIWASLASDPDAVFDIELTADAGEVEPMVTWGNSPQQTIPIGGRVPAFDTGGRDTREAYDRALQYMGLEPGRMLAGLPIDGAFIGSCTNSRISDLRRAAALLKDRRVAMGIRAICVPGSTPVKRQAESEGIDRVFLDAGFEWREAGCSMCFYSGGESFGPRERVVTSTNRNFESRQGPEVRSHLASPETVAASAVAGRIADPRALAG